MRPAASHLNCTGFDHDARILNFAWNQPGCKGLTTWGLCFHIWNFFPFGKIVLFCLTSSNAWPGACFRFEFSKREDSRSFDSLLFTCVLFCIAAPCFADRLFALRWQVHAHHVLLCLQVLRRVLQLIFFLWQARSVFVCKNYTGAGSFLVVEFMCTDFCQTKKNVSEIRNKAGIREQVSCTLESRQRWTSLIMKTETNCGAAQPCQSVKFNLLLYWSRTLVIIRRIKSTTASAFVLHQWKTDLGDTAFCQITRVSKMTISLIFSIVHCNQNAGNYPSFVVEEFQISRVEDTVQLSGRNEGQSCFISWWGASMDARKLSEIGAITISSICWAVRKHINFAPKVLSWVPGDILLMKLVLKWRSERQKIFAFCTRFCFTFK